MFLPSGPAVVRLRYAAPSPQHASGGCHQGCLLVTKKPWVSMDTTVDGRISANQLRLVVFSPLFTKVFLHPRWCRISEPSTV